ncbi:MAG: hypothetical protein FWD58_04975 [Firmicutes bacterium]|nr:hypothetical protein [Bacillota bacterium]
MKKFVVTVLAVAICFAAAISLTACGDYDDSALLAEIAQLKQELADAKAGALKGDPGEKGDKGDKGDPGSSGNSETLIIHKLGDTVTVYEQGAPMFSIKYDSKNTYAEDSELLQVRFTLKNYGIQGGNFPNGAITARGVNADFRGGASVSSSLPSNTHINEQVQFDALVHSSFKYVFFKSDTTHLTYAIFEV